jgi:threonine aldolase
MKKKLIDLISDTVTKPTAAMLEAMFNAEVGDDVFGEDPTVNKLEAMAAEMLGMEAGLYCPSGTQTNQIALKILTQPQDEVICDKLSHIYLYEAGGVAFNSGVSVRLINGDRGRITVEQIEENINPKDPWYPQTSLVSLENTVNKGGGSYYTLNEMKKISVFCRSNNLKIHLDGARLFNALVETGEDSKDFGKYFDTISICISKGLGAPVGSLLLSSKENILRARRVRKVFGGGMRQAGYMAAACIYALENNIERLKEDHSRARNLGEAISKLNFVEEVLPVDTNIIIVTLRKENTSSEFVDQLMEKGIRCAPFGKYSVRFVTHLDFDDKMLDKTVNIFAGFE